MPPVESSEDEQTRLQRNSALASQSIDLLAFLPPNDPFSLAPRVEPIQSVHSLTKSEDYKPQADVELLPIYAEPVSEEVRFCTPFLGVCNWAVQSLNERIFSIVFYFISRRPQE